MPQAVGRLVGRPAPDVELPGALPRRVLRQPRDARLPRPAALAHGRPGGSRALRRGAHARRSRDRLRLATPGRSRSRATPTTSRSRRAAASPSASTRSCSPRTPTRRWRCSPTRATASTSCSARSPTSPTRPCCTPTARCCRAAGARGRAGTTTCSTSPPARSTVTYHMNRLQSLRADREFCVTLNRTRGDRPGEGDPHDRSTRTRSSPPPAGRRRRATPRSAAATARTTAAPTGAGASTRTASPARCASRERLGGDRL